MTNQAGAVLIKQGTRAGSLWELAAANTYKQAGYQKVTIVSVQQNYLTCTDALGKTVYVAKPTRLRATDTAARAVENQSYTLTKSAFSSDGQSCTGTRSSDSATETLGVDEPYLANDEICAVSYPTGLTDPNGKPIVLLDVNVDARHWAAASSS